jgi:hypothetical protein
MRLDTRPLLDNARDAQLFTARQREAERLILAAREDLNALVLGERGMGKSSLLRFVAWKLRDQNENAVVVDVNHAETAVDVLYAIQNAIGRAPHLGEVVGQSLQRALKPSLAPASQLIDLVATLDIETRLVLLIDNLPSAAIGQTLFGRLRDELWQLPHTWLVAAGPADREVLLAPPADAFFATTVELGPLDERAARIMLGRRLDTDTVEIAKAVAATGEGNPRRLLDLAREAVFTGIEPGSSHQRRVAAQTAASELGGASAMLYAELEALGSASASDADLLRRLGWTRPRATQVFKMLEANGLVVASEERPDGRGRPRRVYRPAVMAVPGNHDPAPGE